MRRAPFVLLLLLALPACLRAQSEDNTDSARSVGFPIGELDSKAEGRFFRVQTTAAPTTLEVEEPFTLTVRITTPVIPRQPPRRLDLSENPAFADRFYIVDTVEPPPDMLTAGTLAGLLGSPGSGPLLAATAVAPQTEWIYVYRLKPRNAEVREVPIFTFACFDPDSRVATPERRWHVPYAPPIPLTVRPQKITQTELRAPGWAFELAAGDLLAHREPRSLPGSLALALLLAAPPVLCLGWYLIWRRMNPDAARLALVRRSRSARRALDAIARARRLASGQRPDAVALAVARYLRERFDFPAAEPTAAEVHGHLMKLECSAAIAEQADAYFQLSDAQRFLPAAAGYDDLPDAAERLILALEAATGAPRHNPRPAALALLLCMLGAGGALGAESLFAPETPSEKIAERGIAAFSDGVKERAARALAVPHFHDAAQCFAQLHRRGVSNEALYRNLGNAHLLADENGEAILAYRRGLRLRPWDAGLRAGLAEARKRMAPGPSNFGRPPVDHRPAWLLRVQPQSVFIVAMIVYALACILLTRWLMTRSRSLLALGLLCFMLAGGLGASVVLLHNRDRSDADYPLVVLMPKNDQEGVLMRKGNGDAFPPRYDTPLHRGAEARLLHQRGDWLQIELTGGEVGWVPAAAAVVAR